MKYKKNFFFVAGIFIKLLSHNVYCGEYNLASFRNITSTNAFLQDKKHIDNLRNDLQELDKSILLFEDSIKKNTNFKELDNKQFDELLFKAKNFATKIMNIRQAVEESNSYIQKYQEKYQEILMSKKERCAIIRKLENMYAENDSLQGLLGMAKRVKDLKF